MTLKRFRHLAQAYGADLARWPSAEREAARALSVSSVEAATLLAEERALDDMLRRAAPGIDDAEIDRVLNAIDGRIDRMTIESGGEPVAFAAIPGRFGAAGLLAAMALAGFLIGNIGLVLFSTPSSAVADDGFNSLSVTPSLRDVWTR